MSAPFILIVEVDRVAARIIEEILKAEQYGTAHASCGEEALSVMERRMPLLVLSEIALPRMDGFMFLREANARWPGVPFIIMTMIRDVKRDIAVIVRAMREGAAGYLVKPFTRATLLSSVTEAQLVWAKSPHVSANPSPAKADKKSDELLEIWAKAVQTGPGLSQRELRVLGRTERGSVGFALLAYDSAIVRGLSLREREISTLVGLNLGNKGIARLLSLSESTVKAHLQVIFRKTGLGTRAALARFALVALAEVHDCSFGLVHQGS